MQQGLLGVKARGDEGQDGVYGTGEVSEINAAGGWGKLPSKGLEF